MQKIFRKFPIILAAVLGFIFLLPLIALEVVNRWQFNESFPVALFTFAWVLQTIFILILTPMIKTVRSGKPLTKNPADLLIRVAVLALIASIWSGWVIDQWPCLMGVPNCD